MQADVPRITQRTAIIYTRCPAGMTAEALASSGGVPFVRQSPSLESLTGLRTISGGYSDNRIRISATSKGELDFKIYSANWAGKITFNLTATTSGAVVSSGGTTSNGWIPGSATYPITVYAFGNDRPYTAQNYYEFKVGEKVDFTITGSVVAPRLAEVGADGATMLNRAGTSAGLQTQMVGGDNPTGIRVFGTPETPGIYTLGIIMRSDEGAPPHQPVPFPAGESEDLVIISIVGDRIEQGDPVVMIPARHSDGDSLRILHHNAVAAYGGEAGTSALTHVGSEWRATVTSSSGDNLSERWVYTIAPVSGGKSWTWGVVYSASGIEGMPVSATLATAPGRELASGEWQQIPPKQGWSPEVILQGEESLYLTSATSGGYAGAYCLAGSASGAVLYEQQPLYTRQYSGWSRPPSIRNSNGKLIALRSDGYFGGTTATELIVSGGVAVNPEPPSGVVLPYCPPRVVSCGNGITWRDPGFLIPAASGGVVVHAINASGSACVIRVGSSAGAGWGGRYPMRRLLPLFRNIPRKATFTATKKSSEYNYSSSIYNISSIEYYPHDYASGLPRTRTSGGSTAVSGERSHQSTHISQSITLDGARWTSAMLAQEFGFEQIPGGGSASRDEHQSVGSSAFFLGESFDESSGWIPYADSIDSISVVSSGAWVHSSAVGEGVGIDAAIYYGDGRDSIDSGRMFVAVGQARATGQIGLTGRLTTNYVSSAWKSDGTDVASSSWTSSSGANISETFAHALSDLTPHVFTDETPHFSGKMLISTGEYSGLLDVNAGVIGDGVPYDGGYFTMITGGLIYDSREDATKSAWCEKVTTTYHSTGDPYGEPWNVTITSSRESATGSAALEFWTGMSRAHSDSGFVASGSFMPHNSGSWIYKRVVYVENESTSYESASLNI